MSRSEMLARIEQTAGMFRSFRGLTRITMARDGDKKTTTQALLAEYPDKLRVEVLGLFGAPALLATTDGARTTILLPGESRAYVGPAGNGFLQRVTRLPLRTTDIVAFLLQKVEPIPWEEAEVDYSEAGNRLTLITDQLSQVFSFNRSGDIQGVDFFYANRRQLGLSYGEYVEGFPRQIDLVIPDQSIDVKMELSEIELNIDHKEGVFRLDPPASYMVVPIPQEG
ncbi:MAG: hypothetical protein C0615_08725 [Desulfuromonas sp.]|nr:MAG: hypothetical protein C0615_08725 [Desulfuromonas sp.]